MEDLNARVTFIVSRDIGIGDASLVESISSRFSRPVYEIFSVVSLQFEEQDSATMASFVAESFQKAKINISDDRSRTSNGCFRGELKFRRRLEVKVRDSMGNVEWIGLKEKKKKEKKVTLCRN